MSLRNDLVTISRCNQCEILTSELEHLKQYVFSNASRIEFLENERDINLLSSSNPCPEESPEKFVKRLIDNMGNNMVSYLKDYPMLKGIR
jgi:hypothetical protein